MTEGMTGVVLAGGASRRMGRDKALLTMDGRTLLEIQVEKLRRLGIGDVVIAGRTGAVGGARSVPDASPGMGPLAGLCAGLAAARCPHCLVLGVDTPLVPEAALAALAASHLANGCDATLLAHGGRREPLVAAYRADLAARAAALLAGEDRSLRALLRQIDCREWSFDGPEALLVNINAPGDYRRALEIASMAGREAER